MAQYWERSPPRCHMWVEFVVGSLLCSEKFFSGYSSLLKNQHFQIPILAWEVSPISAIAIGTLDTQMKWIMIMIIITIIIIIIIIINNFYLS